MGSPSGLVEGCLSPALLARGCDASLSFNLAARFAREFIHTVRMAMAMLKTTSNSITVESSSSPSSFMTFGSTYFQRTPPHARLGC